MHKYLLLLMFFPFFAFADDVHVFGAGTDSVNGWYEEQMDGTWLQQSGVHYIHPVGTGGRYCRLGLVGDPDNQLYYRDADPEVCDSSFEVAGADWVVADGVSPSPDVEEGTAPPYVPPVDPSFYMGTSTPDQVQQNTFNGFVLFFFSMAFIVWIMKKR